MQIYSAFLFALTAMPLLISCLTSQLCPRTAVKCTTSKPKAFYLAGDSTTAVQSTNGGGWGTGFLSFLTNGAIGGNYGHNGATTVSFKSGGDWAKVIEQVENDRNNYEVFVTIQFGHNDQKTDKGISITQFQTNLQNFAHEVKTAGGTPILITPLTRRQFSSEHDVKQNLAKERQATINAAQVTGTQYIDLNAASTAYVNAVGKANVTQYNLVEGDNTHLNTLGSTVFGRMVADLLLGHAPVLGGSTPAGSCLGNWIRTDVALSQEIWAGKLAGGETFDLL